jgi:hypothetical protein
MAGKASAKLAQLARTLTGHLSVPCALSVFEGEAENGMPRKDLRAVVFGINLRVAVKESIICAGGPTGYVNERRPVANKNDLALEERLLLAIVVRCMQYLLSWVLRSALNT